MHWTALHRWEKWLQLIYAFENHFSICRLNAVNTLITREIPLKSYCPVFIQNRQCPELSTCCYVPSGLFKSGNIIAKQIFCRKDIIYLVGNKIIYFADFQRVLADVICNTFFQKLIFKVNLFLKLICFVNCYDVLSWDKPFHIFFLESHVYTLWIITKYWSILASLYGPRQAYLRISYHTVPSTIWRVFSLYFHFLVSEITWKYEKYENMPYCTRLTYGNSF